MSTMQSGSSCGAARRSLSIRVWGIFERMGIWMDARSVRAYPQDTHSWSAKTETLRALKTAAHQPARPRPVSAPILGFALSGARESGQHPFHPALNAA